MVYERQEYGDRHPTEARIAPLDELNEFKVADGEPDVRGWDVLASDHKRIGKVHELLVDTGAMQVRYLDVDLDDEYRGDRDRHILVPIGCARLDDEDDRVFIGGLQSTAVATAPPYEHRGVTRDLELSVRGCFEPGARAEPVTAREKSATGGGADFYSSDTYDQVRFFAGRRTGRENEPYLTRSERGLAAGTQEGRLGEQNVSKRDVDRPFREERPEA